VLRCDESGRGRGRGRGRSASRHPAAITQKISQRILITRALHMKLQ
jgi:hypothetical protein